MKREFFGALLAFAGLVVTAPIASAQVGVSIGIQLPGPPALVVVPSTPVYYARSAPANVFMYGEQYWVFNSGAWFVGPTWNGPWAFVQPAYVPAPVLSVPVRYYRGRDWREAGHERAWREREERWRRRH